MAMDGKSHAWKEAQIAKLRQEATQSAAAIMASARELLAEQKRAHAFTRYDQGALLWQSQAAHDLQDLVAAAAAGLPAEGDRDHEDDAPMHE